MVKGLLNFPWFALSALAFVVAIIYSFIWPNDPIRNLTGFRFLVLRWAHAMTWFLLAVNFPAKRARILPLPQQRG